MKKNARIIIFAVIFFVMALANIFSSVRAFSETENRFLAQAPKFTLKSFINGKYTQDFDLYASDQFMGRNIWIALKTKLDQSLLKQDNGRIYFGKDNYLFDVDQKLDANKFYEKMNTMNTLHANMNHPLDIVLIPSKSMVYSEYLPYKAPIQDEKVLFKQIGDALHEEINLYSMLDVFSDLNDESLYYKTDHHYTTLGAYYAYQSYLENIGLKAYPLEEFERILVSDEFLGSQYRKANYYQGPMENIEAFKFKEDRNLSIIRNNQEVLKSLYDESFLDKSDKYSYFLGGDHPLLEITTDVDNNQSLLLVKDSFANSLIPFLSLHFERIVVVDQRYYKRPIQEIIESMDYDRVLYVFNLKTFYDQ